MVTPSDKYVSGLERVILLSDGKSYVLQTVMNECAEYHLAAAISNPEQHCLAHRLILHYSGPKHPILSFQAQIIPGCWSFVDLNLWTLLDLLSGAS